MIRNVKYKLKSILCEKWKVIFLVSVIVILCVLGIGTSRRTSLLLQGIFEVEVLRKVIILATYILMVLLILLLFFLAFNFIAMPLNAHKIELQLARAGLLNSKGETVQLLSKMKDKNKYKGEIIVLYANTLSILDFDKNIHKIESAINRNIYQLEYAPNDMSVVYLYTIKRKYNHDRLITLNDNYLTNIINLLVVGATGTGKSYALKVILAKIVKFNPETELVICDYKKSSFSMYENTDNFYGYEDCDKGIYGVYQEFCERLKLNDEKRNAQKIILVIDEYGALISTQEKKKADELKKMISNMLFMGRSLGVVIVIGVQRADSELFRGGARDQFRNILALGNLSKEQKGMLFNDYKDLMNQNNTLGQGYLYIDGKGIERIKVESIVNEVEVDNYIIKAMSR